MQKDDRHTIYSSMGTYACKYKQYNDEAMHNKKGFISFQTIIKKWTFIAIYDGQEQKWMAVRYSQIVKL